MYDDTKRTLSPIISYILHLSFVIYYRSSQTCLVFLPQTCRVRVPCSRHNHLVGSARSSTRTRPELSDNCIFAKRIVSPDSHGPIGRSWSMILLLCPELSYYQTIITFTMQLCTSKKKYFQTFPEPTSGKESGSGHWKLSVTGTMFVSSCKAVESSRRKLSSSSTCGEDLQTNGLLCLKWVIPGPGRWEAKLKGSGECLASGEKDHIKIGIKGHICKMTTFQDTIFREWVTRTTVMLRSSVLPGRWLSPYTLNPDVLMFLKK